MKDCFYQYRKGLYEALSTLIYEGSAISVVEYGEAEKATPFIEILNMNSSLERDDDVFMQAVTTDIMVVTSHQGDPGQFGSKQSDDIMNLIMEKLITKGVTVSDRAAHIVMDDFEDAGCYFVALNYQSEFDGIKTTIRKILTVQTMIDENV